MRPALASRALALTLALSLATPALAQPTSAHESAATTAYDRGDLTTALREFEAAYADTPRPDLLYVIGKLHAARGDCDRAIEQFNRFLATKPGPNATDGARAEITKCEKVLADQRAAEAAAPDTTATHPDTTTDSEPAVTGVGAIGAVALQSPPADRGNRRDKLAIVMISGGVTFDLVGLLLYQQARDAQCGPVCTGIDYDEYRDKEQRASTLRLAAIGVAGVGTALLGAGVWRYVTHKRERRAEVGLIPNGGGGAVVISGHF